MTIRRRPGTESRPASTPPSATADSSVLHRPEDGHQAPTAEDRNEAALLAELESLGYRIAVPCLICRRPLTSKRSLRSHVGPVCSARMAVAR